VLPSIEIFFLSTIVVPPVLCFYFIFYLLTKGELLPDTVREYTLHQIIV
jgi:hypothetical protein